MGGRFGDLLTAPTGNRRKFARATGWQVVGACHSTLLPKPEYRNTILMAKFSDVYAHDKTAAEEGVWTPIGNGIKIKVRAFDSAHTRALRTKLQEPYKAILRNGKDIPEDDAQEINTKLIAGSSLLGWNLTEGTGEFDAKGVEIEREIPFSAEAAERFLRDEPRFARDVISALMADETFKKQNREADGKNS